MLRPALLIALALAVAALAGCGGGGSAGTTGGASGPARQSSTPPQATEPGKPAKPGHGAVGEVRMLGHGFGWAIADGELLWTEDEGREWSSITPPGGERVGIDFLDRRHGWVATGGSEGPDEHLSIYFTTTAGPTGRRRPSTAPAAAASSSAACRSRSPIPPTAGRC